MPSIGSLKIRLGFNLNPLIKDAKKAEFLLKRSAAKYKAVGASLTNNITLPILGAAAASAKLATDIQSNFGKIENLVGVSGKALQDLKAGVASVSDTTAKSQAELSKALFDITSAGQRGNTALVALRQSAKASQIGLGEVNQIASTATSVLNAYGKENISAARSVDILTAIVREGKVEAETLAPSLGRVIGIASQMGVSFEEVGASVATFTRLGVGAEEAVTGLRAILTTFLKPGAAAKDVLKSLGLTSQEVRDSIRENGLADTLVDLQRRLGGNQEALATLIPNVRALSTVLGTAGSQSQTYREILDNLANSTGIVDKGFQNVSKSAGFRFKSALVNLQNASIELGAKLLPVITKAVNIVSGLVTKWRNLDEATQSNVIRFAAFAAAAGPVLSVIGSLKSVAATAVGIFIKLAKTVAAISSPVTIVIGVLGAGATYIANNWEKVRGKLTDVTNSMIGLYNESIAFRGIVELINGGFKLIKLNVKSLFSSFGILASAIGDVFSGDLGISEAFTKVKGELAEEAKNYAESFKSIVSTGLNNVIDPKEMIKPITEQDIQEVIADPIINVVNQVKKQVEGIFDFGSQAPGGGGSSNFQEDLGPSRGLLPQAADIGGGLNNIVSEQTIERVNRLKEGLKATSFVMKSDVTNALERMQAEVANADLSLKGMATTLFLNLAESLKGGAQNFREFASKAISSIRDTVSELLRLFVAKQLAGLPLGLGLLTGAVVGGAASTLFNTIISQSTPKFAAGGVITSPTYGLMGEYAGANTPGRSEIVTPEQLMRKIVREEGGGGRLQIEGRLQGEDIYLLNQRATYRKSRTTIR